MNSLDSILEEISRRAQTESESNWEFNSLVDHDVPRLVKALQRAINELHRYSMRGHDQALAEIESILKP